MIKGWKSSFFFIKKSVLGIEGELNWRGMGKVKYPPSGIGEYNAVSVVMINPLVFNFRKLSKRVLIMACMSLLPSSPAYPLKKDDKSIIICYFL